jgi:hypothetical protein
MDWNQLLVKVSGISRKYEMISQKTGGHFNIFNIADIATDEVTICRVLYELINPRGSHYQGDAYLRLFDQYVLKMGLTEEDFKSAAAQREHVISDDRRIDLVITTRDKFIPIEVKIYAMDQNRQCYDYSRHRINSKVFYLTLDGNPPSAESAQGLKSNGDDGYDEVTQISFRVEVLNWLEKCLEHHETIKIAPIRETIQQLASVVRDLTGQVEEGEAMEIKTEISSSKESMKAAIDIERNLSDCKRSKLLQFFIEVEAKVNMVKLSNGYDYSYNNNERIANYYPGKKYTWPGISYFCRNLSKPGVELWLRVELEDRMFVGFLTPRDGKNQMTQVTDDELALIVKNRKFEHSTWWVYMEDVVNPNTGEKPNFKLCDDGFLNLFDKTNFDSFVQATADTINRLYRDIVPLGQS